MMDLLAKTFLHKLKEGMLASRELPSKLSLNENR
jgi:hypothetical protein